MKKKILSILVLTLGLAGTWLAYHNANEPTHIAFVNFLDFMIDPIYEANDNEHIIIEQVKMDEDTFRSAGKYDVMIVFAHGGVRLTPEQEQQIKERVAAGTEIIFRSPIPDNRFASMKAEDIVYVKQCMDNANPANIRRMLNYCRKVFHGKSSHVIEIEAPFIYPKNYFYHLGDEDVFETREAYDAFLKASNRHKDDAKRVALIGAGFGSSGENSYRSKLIRKLEAAGHQVYPINAMGPARLEFVKAAEPDIVVFFPHGRFAGQAGIDYLKEANIPMLCPIFVLQPENEWRADLQGMAGGMLSQSVTMPEMDGGAVPYVLTAQTANERGSMVMTGIEDRLDSFVGLTGKYLSLKDTPNSEKKIAIFYYKEAGRNELVAESLEVVPSLFSLLQRMKAEGYNVAGLPDSVEGLEALIQKKGPTFGTYAEGSMEDFSESGDPVLLGQKELDALLAKEISPQLIDELKQTYGEAPGELMTASSPEGRKLMVARVDLGNVVLLPVPPAGGGDDDVALTHGAKVPPPYPYVGAYLWAKGDFNADVLVHFGTHGSVEFTPQKQVALSETDWPEALTGGVPHTYLYVISNIGEAMIAKRRTYAVMNTHLTSPLTESGLYGTLDELHIVLEKVFHSENPALREEYHQTAHKLVLDADLHLDLEIDVPEEGLIPVMDLKRIHHQLHDLAIAKIVRGMHVLGEAYTDEEVEETVRIMALDALVYNKIKMDKAQGKVSDEDLEDAHFMDFQYRAPASDVVFGLLAEGKSPAHFLNAEQKADLRQIEAEKKAAKEKADAPKKKETKKAVGKKQMPPHVKKMIDAHKAKGIPLPPQHVIDRMIAEGAKTAPENTTHDSKERTYREALVAYNDTLQAIDSYRLSLILSPTLELDALINSFNGGYTAPQTGGDPAFNPDAVPSGRNLISINEMKVPSKEAFRVAKRLVDRMLERQKEATGSYPRRVALSLWSSEFIRQEGITIAEALYLMGVEPVTDARGTVHDVKLIPMAELGRPRIDVVVQTSGQFRDLAASRIYLINRAAKLAAEAKDADGQWENYVREGVQHSENLMKQKGASPARARELAHVRVFGGLNGNYGAAIMGMVEDGDSWESEDEIAQRYLVTMGALYGEGIWGDYQDGAFEAALKNTDMVIHPRSSNTWGALSLDHVYEFMGGISRAAQYVNDGKEPKGWFSDLRNPNNPRIETLEQAIWTEARTTILNPKFIENMQKEGPSAAGGFAETFRNMFGWEAMQSSAIDPEMWDKAHEVYVQDKHNLGVEQYFAEKNPYALQEMTAIMLETVRKDYWQPSEEVVKEIAELHAKLVKNHDAGCSGFVCNNEALQAFIASNLDPDAATELNEALDAVRNAENVADVEGLELSKAEPEKAKKQRPLQEEGQRQGGKVLLVVLLLTAMALAFKAMVKKQP